MGRWCFLIRCRAAQVFFICPPFKSDDEQDRSEEATMSAVRCLSLAVALLLVQVAHPMRLAAPSRRVTPVATMVARFAPLCMQEGSRERENKKGRQATIARPKPKPKEKSKEEVDKEGEWKVLLHNDDVSLYSAPPTPTLFARPCNSSNSMATASQVIRCRAADRCTPLTT